MTRFAEVTHRGWIAAPMQAQVRKAVHAASMEDQRDIATLGYPDARAAPATG